MPTEIIISNQKYYNQLKNGVSFGDNTGDYTLNFVGNVGERIRCTFDVEIYWYFIGLPSNQITISDTATKMSRQTGSWITDGFSAGDTCYIKNRATGDVSFVTINSRNALVAYITLTGGDPLPDAVYDTMTVSGYTPLTALIYKFGLIGNDENFTCNSKVSLNEQGYYAGNINVSTPTYKDFTRLGNYKDWISGGTQKVKWLSTQVIDTYNTIYSQKYNIVTDIIINPFFLKEYKDNLQDETIPDLFTGSNALKYVFECSFMTSLSNPNTAKTARLENNLGSIGWYDENFNGFQNIYSIDSIIYTDSGTGDSCDGLQVGYKTKAIITINKDGGFLNLGEPFGVMVFFAPDDTSLYQDTLTSLEENFLFDNAINDEGASTVTGVNGIIKSCVGAINGSNQLVITAEFDYTALQQAQLQDNPKYLIGILVADDTITAANSDKVMLSEFNDYVYSADISGLMGVTAFRVIRHDNQIASDLTLWNEDGVNLWYSLWLDTSQSAIIKSLDFALVAYKTSDDTYFILDKKSFNTSNSPIVSGTQMINIQGDRGYELDANDQFNLANFTTNPIITMYQGYFFTIGQKIKWQDWIQNLLVDTDFFDTSKLNNNLNYKSDNYCSLQSGITDYSIRFMIVANVQGIDSFGNTGNTLYKIISPEQLIYDYAKPTYWTATIETFDKTGTINLGGAIRHDDYTLMKVTWQCANIIYPYYNIWAIHRIEESQENGDNIFEHSTLYDRIFATPFTEQTGATTLRLKQTVDLVNNKVITEDFIDYTKLDSTKNYKLSARLSYDKLSITVDAKITEDGIWKITENNQIKIVE